MVKKKIKIYIIILIVLAAGGTAVWYYIKGKNIQPVYTTVKALKADIIQTVSETGTVKPSSEINLNFLNNGNIAKILVKTGAVVKQGQILAELDYSGLLIKQQEAKASLEIARANLNKVLSGATSQEIAVVQANVNQAKKSYDSAVNELATAKKTVNENISQAQKTLDDLQQKTANNVTTYEQALSAAQTNLDNTKRTYQQAISNKQNSALTTVDGKISAAKTALDSINTILNDNDAKNTLSVRNPSSLADTKTDYNKAVGLFNAAKSGLATVQNKNTDSNAIKQSISDATVLLNSVFEALNSSYGMLENTIVSSDFTQTELDAYKTSISAQLTTVSAGIAALQTAEQNLDDAILNYNTYVASAEKNLAQAQTNLDNAVIGAQNALSTAKVSGDQQITAAQSKINAARQAWQVAEAELAKINAPAKSQDIDLNRAQVAQAQAAMDSIANQIQNSVIKAPIDGIVNNVAYEIGEQPMAGKPVISMLAENNFDIEVDVSEADIAKVKLNNPAEITLDAFGEDYKFSGKVYSIDPAETKIQDVIYYKLKINFDDVKKVLEQSNNSSNTMLLYYKSIKPGMTANINITTAGKRNALIIPSRAIIEKTSGEKIVRVLSNGNVSEMPVVLGLKGDEGMVEVLSGIKEGDDVVTFVK